MKKSRCYGIDLLRIVSMFLIVTLHVMGHGGVLNAVAPTTMNYKIAWFIEIASYCAVNCYALISGYVGIDANYKTSNVLYLWLQVAFYSVGITLLFALLTPGKIGINSVLHAFFPVLYEKYWYFTAYFCMFFFIPIFNHIVHTMNKKEMQRIVICLIVFFSLITTWRNEDVFGVQFGYNAIWLGIMYIIGAYIKHYVELERIRGVVCLMIYILCIMVTWSSKFVLPFFIEKSVIATGKETMLIKYTSPTILLASIALLLLFAKIKVTKGKKIIGFLSSLTFGVYLIHDNPLIRQNVIYNLFSNYVQLQPIYFVWAVFLTVLCIYLICSLLDYIRFQLFRILKVKTICESIDNYSLPKNKGKV